MCKMEPFSFFYTSKARLDIFIEHFMRSGQNMDKIKKKN